MLDIEQIQDTKDNNLNLGDEFNCFSRVIVSPKIHQYTEQYTWLTAKDKKTNEQFKCKVSFGKIHKIQITKKFNQMSKGETSELNVNVIINH